MAELTQLGSYWGKDGLYCVESVGNIPRKCFHIPFTDLSDKDMGEETYLPTSLNFVTELQEKIQKQRISSPTVVLSLPTKDIIFRSFIIPWMPKSDIKGVINFEVRKYIPFDIEELAFAYHSETVTEDKTKNIRVTFAAIKKDVMKNYINIIQQAALNPYVIEPSTQSTLRALFLQNRIDLEDTAALIERADDQGKIIIMERGVPDFVREFQLGVPNVDDDAYDQDAMMTRLINEVRISLDYFDRQAGDRKVKKIYYLSAREDTALIDELKNEIDMPINKIMVQEVLPNKSMDKIEYISAFGASIVDEVDLKSNFDLSIEKTKSKRGSGITGKTSKDLKPVALMGALAVFICIASFIFSSKLTAEPQKKFNELNKQLGTLKTATEKTILDSKNQIQVKIDNFKNILIKSDAASFLALIPEAMPQGIWLQSLDISYEPAQDEKTKMEKEIRIKPLKPIISLKGYSYTDNFQNQYQLIQDFLFNLRADDSLVKKFNDIKLDKYNTEKFDSYNVTSFQIVME